MASPTISIDVTPILPGGENGGAKVFVLDLIRGLARMTPQAQYILLTQASSHDELSTLDCKNVRRVMILGAPNLVDNRASTRNFYLNLAPRIPAFFRRRLAQGAYTAHRLLKRVGSRQRIVRHLGADLLFCPFTAPIFYDKSVPTVCTIYDLQFADYPFFFEPEDFANRKSMFLDACRKATILVAISEFSRKTAIDYGRLAPNRIKTIALRMAQRMPPNNLSSAGILGRLGLTPLRYLLYPSNFWKHKNHEMLLTAFGMSFAQGLPQDIKLVCTGESSERRNFIQRAAITLGLASKIVFPGYLSNTELSSLLHDAGGLVFPSLYEGFGLPVLEAMATGVPVACSNTTSLPEIAGNAALFFDPKKPSDITSALINIISNAPLRRKLIKAGRQQAEQYTDTDRMISDYWNIFESVLNVFPRSRR